MSKIGIFGGTLNPIHLGHINLIVEAKSKFNLDKIIIIPAFQSPHKIEKPLRTIDRVNMIKLATQALDFVEINLIEIERKGTSYTYDTIRSLKEVYSEDELYFIIGEDQYQSFNNWYKHEELLHMIQFIVLKRSVSEQQIKSPFLSTKTPIFEISSNDIRTRIKNNSYYSHLVHKDVFNYIKEHRLYEYRQS